MKPATFWFLCLVLLFLCLPTLAQQFAFTQVPHFVGPCEPLALAWSGGVPPFEVAVAVPDTINGFITERRMNVTDRFVNSNLTQSELATDSLIVDVFDATGAGIHTDGDNSLFLDPNDCNTASATAQLPTGGPAQPLGGAATLNSASTLPGAGVSTAAPAVIQTSTAAISSVFNASPSQGSISHSITGFLPPPAITAQAKSSSSGSSSLPVGAIVGISIGGLVMGLVFSFLVFYLRRLRRAREKLEFDTYSQEVYPSEMASKISTNTYSEPYLSPLRLEDTEAYRNANMRVEISQGSSTSEFFPQEQSPMTSTQPSRSRRTSRRASEATLLQSPVPTGSSPLSYASQLGPLQESANALFTEMEFNPTEETRARIQQIQRQLAKFDSQIEAELYNTRASRISRTSAAGRLADITRRADSLIEEKGRITGLIPPPAYD